MWPISFLLHEWCHCLEGFRQGNKECKIFVKPTTMLTDANDLYNYSSFCFAGGVLSGLALMIAGLFPFYTSSNWDFPFGFAFIFWGTINLIYGIYEGFILPRWHNTLKYKIGRYSIYLIVGLLLIFLFWNRIVDFCYMGAEIV